MYDLLLKAGAVFDSANGLSGAQRDIAIQDGVIAAVREAIDPGLAREVRDLSGAMVSAGWIDIHVHAYGGIALGDVQLVGVLNGATTIVDAGDFGTATFADFEALSKDSVADVYGYIHMHPNGIPYTGVHRADYRDLDVDALVDLIERRGDIIKGLKLGALGDLPFHNIQTAKAIATRAKTRYFMHLGEVNHFPAKHSLTRQAVALLTEGDIATHIYTNDHGRIIDGEGRVVPEIFEARDRGVLFDIGHGVGNFSYAIAERAMDQGIYPDTISSDQNSLCANVRADLPATMSRFFLLGMSLEDIVHRVTAAPAKALGLARAGTLAAGNKADITVFRVESGGRELLDSDGGARTTDRMIVADHVYKDGRYHRCDVERIYREDNFVMKMRPAADARELDLEREDQIFLDGLFAALETLDENEWRGETVHRVLDRTVAETGMARRRALRMLYRLVLAPASSGFTPQIGCILARMGAEGVRACRDVPGRAVPAELKTETA